MSGLEKYRTLVTEALRPLLDEAELARAVDAWAAAFGAKPALIPSMVAAHLAKTLELRDKEEGIRTRLTQALLEEHGAKPVPGAGKHAEARAHGASRKPDAAATNDGSVIFRAMLSGIIERARELLGADAKGMESEWSEVLKGRKLGAAARQSIERWCQTAGRGASAQLTADISIEDMRTALHAIYVWCCEALGPVEADRMLAETVEAAAVLPEARRFAPRELL